MAHRRSLLAGIAIGAGAALGIREIVGRLRNRGGAERYRGTDAMLEAEDSRTPSYVPNAGMEAGRESFSGRSGVEKRAKNWAGARYGRKGGADSLRRDIGVIGAREQQKREQEQRRRPRSETSNSGANTVQNQRATGRTSTNTESELRRTGTEDNPVHYTRPTEPPASSGSEAPFIKEGI